MKTFDDIVLQRVTYLRGPNAWTYRSALETWLDLGALEDHPSHLIDGFVDRLCAALPALVEHHCGVGERGGFVQRLREGTWMGHVLEHVIIELLNLAGMPTGFGQTRSTRQRGVYRMVFRARDEAVARAALMRGHRLLMNLINRQPVDVAADVAALREVIDDSYLGPSTAHIVSAATDRGIPHIRLNEGNLVQLGYGATQRRIWTAETDRTSAIAEGIAGDKDLTKRLIGAVGVPVPSGEVAESVDKAWELAQDVGLPVVVKPSDGNHGRGVSLELTTQAEIEAAWAVADAEGSDVLIERYIPGDEHRVLVVGGQVVAAAKGESLWVVGDGQSTIEQLIESQLNSDPRRGEAEEFPLETIVLSREPVIQLLLERQGLNAHSVPEAGRRVLIQRNGNVAIDCTDQVHPEVAEAVSLAARVVGLDIAGIDLVTTDISQPLSQTGGAVVEVNAGPGLLMHLKPAQGSPRPVGKAIVEHLFPGEATGRVPLVGITGSQRAVKASQLTAWLLQLSGRHVGLACQAGLFLDARCVEAVDATQGDVAEHVLMNRDATALVFQNSAANILDQGLVYDRAHVGVVTDLALSPDLARHDVHSEEDLPRALRTQLDVVLGTGYGVLNADDPRVAALAEHCDGDVLLYARHADKLQSHLDEGGRAVLAKDDGRIVLCQGKSETLLPLSRPLDRLSLDEVLPAITVGWAFGLQASQMAAACDSLQAQDLFSGR